MDKRHYVYLLRCADGSLYTGMTPDIARRLRQHVERLPGCAKYTRSHPVTALALLLTTDTATTARQLEAGFLCRKIADGRIPAGMCDSGNWGVSGCPGCVSDSFATGNEKIIL